MEIGITKITIIVRTGTDLVSVLTTKPSPFPFEVNNGQPLHMTFEVQKGKGVEYVRKNFGGIEPEVIDSTIGVKTRVPFRGKPE